MIPTPYTPHLKRSEYISVYPPSEDTYHLLDCIEPHLTNNENQNPLIALEIGSGSGVISTFVKTICPQTFCLAVDINKEAARASQETARVNKQQVEVVCGDLGRGLSGLYGKVDLLIFNPPYVPTESEEVASSGIEASWAGGIDGREVIDKFLPTAAKFLSPAGCFFLLGIRQNKPEEICEISKSFKLVGSIVGERKAGIEKLWVIKFEKSHHE